MELLIYPNLLSIEPLTQEEKDNLERTLIYFLGLLNNLKKIKPSIFVYFITFYLIFNITVVDATLKQVLKEDNLSLSQPKLHQLSYVQDKVTGYSASPRELEFKTFPLNDNLSPDELVFPGNLTYLNRLVSPQVNNYNYQNIGFNVEVLKKGDQGNQVIAIQTKLQQLGYFQGKITGYFGSQTELALKQFQRSKNLTVDGVAGKNTLAMLNNSSGYNSNQNPSLSNPNSQNYSSNLDVLKRGDQGNQVVAMQQKLQQLGYFQGKITGYFGSQTELALKQFQRANNLRVDGVAGKNTLAILNGGKLTPNLQNNRQNNSNNSNSKITQSSPVNPSINLTSSQIKSVQVSLQNLGYYRGNADGNYGAKTHNSLLKFQRDLLTNTNRMLVENFQNYSSSFGYRRSSISNQKEFHQGLDFAAPLGSYVRNWRTGTVIELSEGTGCGTLIRIRSGNFDHIYCHLKGSIKSDSNGRFLSDPNSGLNIREGQRIQTGERIARIGMTGRTTGPHLHWGLKYQGSFIDPFLVLLQ